MINTVYRRKANFMHQIRANLSYCFCISIVTWI